MERVFQSSFPFKTGSWEVSLKYWSWTRNKQGRGTFGVEGVVFFGGEVLDVGGEVEGGEGEDGRSKHSEYNG